MTRVTSAEAKEETTRIVAPRRSPLTSRIQSCEIHGDAVELRCPNPRNKPEYGGVGAEEAGRLFFAVEELLAQLDKPRNQDERNADGRPRDPTEREREPRAPSRRVASLMEQHADAPTTHELRLRAPPARPRPRFSPPRCGLLRAADA